MITLKLCYERRNDSAAFFNVQLESAPLYCFAAILFVQDGGILYVKTIGKEVLYGVIKFAQSISACSVCETGG